MSSLSIFLSFDEVDFSSAQLLRQDLLNLGYHVWWERLLQPGEDKDLRIGQQLREASVVLWCISEKALANTRSRIYGQLRVAACYQKRKRPDTVLFVPVRFSDCQVPNFPFDSGSLEDHPSLDLFFPVDRPQQLQWLHTSLQSLSATIEELASSRAKGQPVRSIRHVATLLHISDLHIGTVDPETLEAQMEDFWAYSRTADSFLGHEYISLDLLDQLYAKLMDDETIPWLLPEQEIKIPVLMTGDLTCFGSEEQFTKGMSFLGQRLCFDDGRPCLGLEAKTWNSHAVPGDHDHWPGSYLIVGQPSSGLSRAYPECPFKLEAIPLSDTGFTLRFMGIDTNADISTIDRFLGRGGCCDQLDELAKMLDECAEKEVRILLLHHCRSYDQYVRGLASDSRKKLDEFIIEHNISVLLSGHLHEPHVQLQKVETEMGSVSILEGRCGTTTQMTTLPYEWRRRFGSRVRPPRVPYNTLLLHRLHADDDALYWETTTYLKTPESFKLFVGSDYASVKKELSDTMKVWPR